VTAASVLDERQVAGSFTYPFRGPGRGRRWLAGLALVAFLPLTFVLVFGYAVACVRSAAADPGAAPPRWRVGGRLLADGAWAALQAGLLTLPFALAAWWLGGTLARAWHPTGDWLMDPGLAWTLAVTGAALPWGVVLLVLLPPTLARFAVTGRPADLAALGWVADCVRGRFVAWNLAVVVVTTAWALAAVTLAAGLVGVVPGAFYAILVSAHACAALAPHPPAR
jgi:Protein of unknown function (DUF4013)